MTHWHTPSDPRVFVFGSNLLGVHGLGAAAYAHRHLDAEWGLGHGMMGRSYALPTCSAPGRALPLPEIEAHVKVFMSYAYDHPDVRFFLSEVGCGYAGLSARDIGPMFRGCPGNVDLPPSFEGALMEGERDASPAR